MKFRTHKSSFACRISTYFILFATLFLSCLLTESTDKKTNSPLGPSGTATLSGTWAKIHDIVTLTQAGVTSIDTTAWIVDSTREIIVFAPDTIAVYFASADCFSAFRDKYSYDGTSMHVGADTLYSAQVAMSGQQMHIQYTETGNGYIMASRATYAPYTGIIPLAFWPDSVCAFSPIDTSSDTLTQDTADTAITIDTSGTDTLSSDTTFISRCEGFWLAVREEIIDYIDPSMSENIEFADSEQIFIFEINADTSMRMLIDFGGCYYQDAYLIETIQNDTIIAFSSTDTMPLVFYLHSDTLIGEMRDTAMGANTLDRIFCVWTTAAAKPWVLSPCDSAAPVDTAPAWDSVANFDTLSGAYSCFAQYFPTLLNEMVFYYADSMPAIYVFTQDSVYIHAIDLYCGGWGAASYYRSSPDTIAMNTANGLVTGVLHMLNGMLVAETINAPTYSIQYLRSYPNEVPPPAWDTLCTGFAKARQKPSGARASRSFMSRILELRNSR